MNDKPKPNKTYMLIGGTDDKCISNGNTWEESKLFKCDYCKNDKQQHLKSNKTHGGKPVCKLCKDLFLVLDVDDSLTSYEER